MLLRVLRGTGVRGRGGTIPWGGGGRGEPEAGNIYTWDRLQKKATHWRFNIVKFQGGCTAPGMDWYGGTVTVPCKYLLGGCVFQKAGSENNWKTTSTLLGTVTLSRIPLKGSWVPMIFPPGGWDMLLRFVPRRVCHHARLQPSP